MCFERGLRVGFYTSNYLTMEAKQPCQDRPSAEVRNGGGAKPVDPALVAAAAANEERGLELANGDGACCRPMD